MPNKLNIQGFGVGTVYGTPTTVALAETSTLSITSSLVGNYHVAGVVAGIAVRSVSTTNGVTGSYAILSGAPGTAFLDGVSNFLVNTTTSVNVTFIGAL